MDKVHLEIMTSLAETLGMMGTSEEAVSEQEIDGDKSVRELLNRLADRYRRFGRMVFDTNAQKLTGRVLIFLNDRDLELIDGLETRLSDGDTLTFVPLIEGG